MFNKKQNAKSIDISIAIDLPTGHHADRIAYNTESGSIKILDAQGNTVPNLEIQRGVHYERPKGKKFQSLMQVSSEHISVGGLETLTHFDSFFVIDTNNQYINGTRVSASFFIRLKLLKIEDKFRILPIDGKAFIYEFHDVPEDSNPEMLAILKLTNDVNKPSLGKKKDFVGFVTDSEMGAHKEISEGKTPIYGRTYLPKNFELLYASADTGQEVLNQLIRICDKSSTNYLNLLKENGLNRTGLKVVFEESRARFRCIAYPDITVTHGDLNELEVGSNTQVTIQFE